MAAHGSSGGLVDCAASGEVPEVISRFRIVVLPASEYGFREYGEPIPVAVDLAPGERVVNFETFHELRSLSDLRMMIRLLIETPA